MTHLGWVLRDPTVLRRTQETQTDGRTDGLGRPDRPPQLSQDRAWLLASLPQQSTGGPPRQEASTVPFCSFSLGVLLLSRERSPRICLFPSRVDRAAARVARANSV